jgi:hypothetical protein
MQVGGVRRTFDFFVYPEMIFLAFYPENQIQGKMF